MPTTSIRGAAISWSEQGEGPVVVYAHGLTSSRARDAELVDWSAVARRHRLVAFDARGHGLSSGDNDPASYAWSELAKDLVEFIREIAPNEKVSGIGLSMGTATMIYAALAAPEIFDRLVLTAVPTAWATRKGQSDLYAKLANLVEGEGLGAFNELMASQPTLPVFADRAARLVPDIDESLLASVLRGAGASDLPEEQLVATIELPTLILAWAGDPGHPVSSAQRLNELIAGSQLKVAETPEDFRAWGTLADDFLI